MLPEEISTPEETTEVPINVDEIWILARLMAVLYFIEFQYGEEATTAMEQVAQNIEASLRDAEGNVS